MLLLPLVASGGKNNNDDAFLQTRVTRDRITQGETLVYEVVLYTTNSSIGGVEATEFPAFRGIDVSRTSADSELTPVEINGRRYFTAVIDRYYLRFPEKGKYKITGGLYKLATYHPREYYDPFWGRQIDNAVEVADLNGPLLTVKVDALPEKGCPAVFSGAVGDYEISASFPDGKLKKGEDAVLEITISGIGSLDGASLPDLPSMLPEGLQFKSMTDNISHYIKDGELGSEVEIECIVMPKIEGKFTVDSISFSYFDIHTRKYKTIKAPVLEIEAGKGLPGTGKPPVIMEI